MTALLIETSSKKAALALSEKGVLKTALPLPGNRELSKILFPELHKLMQGVKFDYIGLGIGPGSYTGLRVGATVAKTLGFALEIPLLSFPSSLDLAAAAQETFQRWLKGDLTCEDLIYL